MIQSYVIDEIKDGTAKRGKIAWLMRYVVMFWTITIYCLYLV